MGQSDNLRGGGDGNAGARAAGAVRLGDAIRQVVEERICPRQTRFAAVSEVWSQLLPSELGRHCRIADISGGQLKVAADSPSHVYELRLCSSQILEELARQCPRAQIKNIAITIG
ncbi:MAG: DciA family protein [Planctomycetota bacterium]|jgi:hypothetical protein